LKQFYVKFLACAVKSTIQKITPPSRRTPPPPYSFILTKRRRAPTYQKYSGGQHWRILPAWLTAQVSAWKTVEPIHVQFGTFYPIPRC
jgi:hypothetical protein